MQKAPRRSPSEWKEIIEDQQKSGLKLRDYGALHQLNYNTLIHWRQKVKKEKSLPANANASGFVKIHQPSGRESLSERHIKISIDKVELNLPIDYQVTNLIELLKGISC